MKAQSQIETVVRSTEIDVNGHVNNAKYLEYLEWGREEWYDGHGLDYQSLRQQNMVTVVVHASVNYRREARQNDHLRIGCTLVGVGNTSFTVQQQVVNDSDETVVDAKFVIVTVSADKREKTPVPDFIRQFVVSSDSNTGETGRV